MTQSRDEARDAHVAQPRRVVPTRLAAATFGGALLGLAFEPLAAAWLAPVAMGVLWACTRCGRLRDAAAAGGCFGLASMLVLLSWLAGSIGVAAWLATSAAMALVTTLVAVGLRQVGGATLAPVWGAALWVLGEAARSSWPWGGMPWGRVGFSAIDAPWSVLVPYAGVDGTGFVLALVGFATADVLRHPGPARRAGLAIGAAGLAAIAAAAFFPSVVPVRSVMTVGVAQGGVPGDGTELGRHHRQVTRDLVATTEDLVREADATGRVLDLVLWPENATAVDPQRDPIARAAVDTTLTSLRGTPLLMAGIVDGPDDETAYNRAMVWSPQGDVTSTYTKQHLVPFGEYIPGRPLIGSWFDRFDRIPRDMVPGDGSEVLQVSSTTVAGALCFDIAYDDVVPSQLANGAELVTVLSSNATFSGTSQLEQQFAITRVRALEYGRTTIVASTNGVSGVIAADGTVVQRATVGRAEVLVADVGLRRGLTPAVRYQDVRGAILIGVSLLGLAASLILSRRRRGRPRHAPNSRYSPPKV